MLDKLLEFILNNEATCLQAACFTSSNMYLCTTLLVAYLKCFLWKGV